MATQDTTVQAFVGLPIESLICDPIIGAAKGQRALAQETLNFVNDLAFLPEDNKDGSKNANIINVQLDRLTNSSTTGEVANVNQTIQMPLISLVNIPNFAMDTMEIDFTMEVKQSSVDTSTASKSKTTDSGAEVKASASWGWGSASVKAHHNVSGTVSSSKTNTRSTDFSAKYHVNATAKQLPPAEGMARFTQILASVIEPIDTSSKAGEAAL
tara:strand:+ start:684 stop:1322 length:639 start_codon:yes stop_codon:yes gene_type:complete